MLHKMPIDEDLTVMSHNSRFFVAYLLSVSELFSMTMVTEKLYTLNVSLPIFGLTFPVHIASIFFITRH